MCVRRLHQRPQRLRRPPAVGKRDGLGFPQRNVDAGKKGVVLVDEAEKKARRVDHDDVFASAAEGLAATKGERVEWGDGRPNCGGAG